MDRLTSMSAFVQVVDSGSFSGAARRLELSPAMVTAHVQSLEQRLGIRLLNRTTRKVGLTEEGAAFYQRCTLILAEVADAESLAGSLQSAPRGTLRINTDVALARMVAPLIAEYVTVYPDVSVELIMTDRIADLVDGQFDLAVHAGPLSDSSLISRRLGTERWVVCASPAYLARRGAPMTPHDLAAHNCLSVANSILADRWRFIAAAGEREIAVTGNFRSNSIEALRAAALSGQGVCLLPLISVADDLAAGRLLQLLPEYAPADTPIQAVYAGGPHMPAKVRTFLDFVAKRLPKVGPARPKQNGMGSEIGPSGFQPIRAVRTPQLPDDAAALPALRARPPSIGEVVAG